MKNKIIIFALFVVILVGSISIIAAEEATFGNNSFEIPEGFDVTESNDTAISLKNDDDYQIFIMTGELLDLKTAKANREALGLKFH